MTLVIATGGVDLSVGSVMAIAGAVAAMLIGKIAFVSVVARIAWRGAGGGKLQRTADWLVWDPAHHRDAHPDGGGSRRRDAAHRWPDRHVRIAPFVYLGNGHFLGLPFTVTIVLFVWLVALAADPPTAMGLFLESIGDNERAAKFCGINTAMVKTASMPAQVCARAWRG